MLMDAALAWAKSAGAVTAWLETSQLDHSGRRRLSTLRLRGICGFDTTLYRGTSAGDETAVYMARLLPG